MSYCLWPHELQRARLPCLSLSPRVCSHSYPLSRWCYLTIPCSASPFCFCLQSFPSSGSFPVSWLFTWGVKVLKLQHQSFQCIFIISFRIDWFDLLTVRGTLFSSTTIWRHQFFGALLSLWSNSYPYVNTGKFDYMDLCFGNIKSKEKNCVYK